MNTRIIDTKKNPTNKSLIGTPTLGIIRFEWAAGRFGQIIPCNWSLAQLPVALPYKNYVSASGVLGCLVADAQNVICQEVVDKNYEWLFLHEDDVILPQSAFIWLNEYMRSNKYPVVSGLYYTKSDPTEPVVYRGRGNSYFDDWKLGDKVFVDGVPTGCLLINGKIIKEMWEDSEPYSLNLFGANKNVRRVFETPRKQWIDPENGFSQTEVGTSDLYWCDRVIKGKYLKKAGYNIRRKYPFLMDTKFLCQHIDLNSGKQYPGSMQKIKETK